MWILEVSWKSLTGKRQTQIRPHLWDHVGRSIWPNSTPVGVGTRCGVHRVQHSQECGTKAYSSLCWQPTSAAPSACEPPRLATPAWVTGVQCPSVPSASHYWAVERPTPSPTARKNSYLHQRMKGVHEDSDLSQHSLLLFKATVNLCLMLHVSSNSGDLGEKVKSVIIYWKRSLKWEKYVSVSYASVMWSENKLFHRNPSSIVMLSFLQE